MGAGTPDDTGRHVRPPSALLIARQTALPAKFEATVIEALGHKPDRPSSHDGIEKMPKKYEVMQPSVEAIKTYIEKHVST